MFLSTVLFTHADPVSHTWLWCNSHLLHTASTNLCLNACYVFYLTKIDDLAVTGSAPFILYLVLSFCVRLCSHTFTSSHLLDVTSDLSPPVPLYFFFNPCRFCGLDFLPPQVRSQQRVVIFETERLNSACSVLTWIITQDF